MSYEKLIKDCFWEYDFTSEEIDTLLKEGSFKEKQFLFEKILANSTQLLRDMELFDKETLQKLLETYSVPRFNYDFLHRRKNILEYYFFDKPLTIDELKWTA